jgi:hypothetical protein
MRAPRRNRHGLLLLSRRFCVRNVKGAQCYRVRRVSQCAYLNACQYTKGDETLVSGNLTK